MILFTEVCPYNYTNHNRYNNSNCDDSRYGDDSHCGDDCDDGSHSSDDCGDDSHSSGYSKGCTYSDYNTYFVLFIHYTNKIIFCKF